MKTPLEKISARLSASREIISAISFCSDKVFGADRRELKALALRLASCSDPRNFFIATDAHNSETGEAYDAYGSLWNCGSKLCPTCLAKHAQKNRKKLREAMNQQVLQKGEKYYFATFTIRNPKLSLIATRELVDRAWTLFRKRKMCVDLIRGGVKSEEFTLSANGYHYHLHCIFRSKFILFNEARRVWTECVETAFREANIDLEINTRDGLLIVKFLPLTNREKAIQEVCKYITKSDSWWKMRREDLTEVALIRRWFRMFELFGSFSNRGAKEPLDEKPSEAKATIVHTRFLSDGKAVAENEYWRDFVLHKGLKAYREHLQSEIASTWQCRREQLSRRWPAAQIEIASELDEDLSKFALTPTIEEALIETE